MIEKSSAIAMSDDAGPYGYTYQLLGGANHFHRHDKKSEKDNLEQETEASIM